MGEMETGERRSTAKKRCCACTYDDFLPDESFQSWGNYVSALRQTPRRFMDRVTARSSAEGEIELKARSQHEMKRTLNWWDIMWLGVSAVMGAGIFVLTGQEARNHVGPAVVCSYAIAGLSALLSVFCYTEFAVEIPVAGGTYAYLRVELGDFVAYIAAGNLLLQYVIGSAAVARSWTSYFATLINKDPNDLRIHIDSFSPGYNLFDPIAVGIIAVICVLSVSSTKLSSRLNSYSSVVYILLILFIIVCGLVKSDPDNFKPFAPFGPKGVVASSAVVFFAYVGFDAISTMAEETKDPARDIPVGLVGSMVMTTVVYCALATTLCLMQPYKSIDENAPFSRAFEAVGWGWAQYLVAAGALKAMTSSLLVGAVGQARYLTHIARIHIVSPWFANVGEKTGTPVNATVFMLVVTAFFALFTELKILADMLSISTLFIYMLVALALLVRRYYVTGETSVANKNKVVACVGFILASSIGTAVYWGLEDSGWVGYCVSLPVWFLGTLGLQVWVPQARQPKTWGVPMVPWLPSLSIGINIFLLGSIDKDSYKRFGVLTVVLLVYYVLFGLHSSYDVAKAWEAEAKVESAVKKTEEGEVELPPRAGDGSSSS